jgi:hypothetical protein
VDLLLDLAKYLISERIARGLAFDIFCDLIPDKPDKVVVLHEYAGPPTTTGVTCVDRSVQISVRSSREEPEWAKKKAWEIFNLLDNPLDRTLDTREHISPGTLWGVVWARQTPFKIGVDQSNRVTYGFNIGISTGRD